MTGTASRRYLSEALGTLVLTVLGPGSAMVAARSHAFGDASVALAFGLAVTLVVASTGRIGGAHINPAVTLGFWSVRRFPARDVLPYVCAQCAGAILGSLLLGWLLGPVGEFGATRPALPLAQSFVAELGFSLVLAFVIMHVASDARHVGAAAPFVIGVTVFAGALVVGPLTGGSFNPARSIGPALASGIWTAHWIYWLAPIAGMMAGMRLCLWMTGATPPLGTPSLGTEGVIQP